MGWALNCKMIMNNNKILTMLNFEQLIFTYER